MSNLRPRLCVLEKVADSYGFHLHTEKGKSGQFIRLVEPDTPASASGLLAGDRLMFVNGENVEDENHQQVVARIRSTSAVLELIVVDADTAELLNKHNLKCQKEFVTEGIVLPNRDNVSERGDAKSNGASRELTPREDGDTSSENSRNTSVRSSTEQERDNLRPRLCHIKKVDNTYGFNLHSKKSEQGQFIRTVDEDSPAQKAGLKPQDKIIQVNGISVAGMQHPEVVTAIKTGGDQTKLLVVDLETEEYFKRCNIEPSEEHLTGPLPVPERSEITAERMAKVSLSSAVSSASSETAATTSTPPEEVQKSDGEAEGLGIGMSVAQAKERAQQKRAVKKAPPMDWRKRNELFSSL
ncbi:Na(+)/H(+) exchange regulatory cofactor NHE-RF1-like isoform X3 [Takifugu flavidus]|uniref:Na(+)/H(+) exchange regulatory cofactor NHE-RF1-like isoform X3 n=1 Tax=Takifugu flavidus TaxID=433684 RepID=UPI002544BAC5|nr:Na(+)/H(+) exchange regulatory cofactor NHE-RF1-like isoform X3 [Takifugu flavidus]